MTNTVQLHISLPDEIAEAVNAKVATGKYINANEVILDGLRSLINRDIALEDWLRREMGPAYDVLKAEQVRPIRRF